MWVLTNTSTLRLGVSYKGALVNWNYRIVKIFTDLEDSAHPHTWYGLFEVYYNKEGLPFTRSIDPINFVGDEGSEVLIGMQIAMNDALKYDILDDADIDIANEESDGIDRDTGV